MTVVGWFWTGCAIPLVLRLGKHLRDDWLARTHDPDPKDPVPSGVVGILMWFLGEVTDYFFEDTRRTLTTVTAFVVGWIVLAMWVGDLTNFIFPALDQLPRHSALALALGLIVEGKGPDVLDKIYLKVFA